jgi:hypothetical protein
MELATYSAVSDGLGHYGAFGGTDPYYGQIELLHSAYGSGDDSAAQTAVSVKELTKQAERNMKGRYPTPVVLRVPQNSTLTPDAATRLMDYLVPGVRFPVRASNTYRQLEQIQKLDRIVFEETANGETINITLSPAPGKTPWDDEGEAGVV